MTFRASKERIKEVLHYALEHGEDKACDTFGIKHDTIRRYKKEYKDIEVLFEQKALLKKVQDAFTDKELKALVNSKERAKDKRGITKISFAGEEIVYGFMTDTHIGANTFDEGCFLSAIEEMEKQGCKFILHSGDVTEGLSNRPGHYYECTHVGADQQKEYAVNLFKQTKLPVYMIDGNHDRWYIKSAGVKIVKDICQLVDNCHYKGQDHGTISVNGVTIELFHGEDSSSYATSYRVQKLIEAIPGGEKPNVLLVGHTHKQGYFFDRNIHAVSGGALSYQSEWMKSKRIACHTGFWIIRMTVVDGEVKSFSPTWYPFYKRLNEPEVINYE